MLRTFAKLRNRVNTRSEEGQGTLEYLGVVVIAAILLVAVIGVFNGFDFEATLDNWLGQVDSGLNG